MNRIDLIRDTIESGFIFKRGVLLTLSGRGALFHAFLTKRKNIIFADRNEKETGEGALKSFARGEKFHRAKERT